MNSFSVFFRRMGMIFALMLYFSTLSACDYLPLGYVSVREVVQNPTQYDGRKVKVKGRISDVTKIPFLNLKFYALNDKGFQIMIVAKEGIPAANKEVAVIGVVENFAIVDNQSLGLHLREIRRIEGFF